MADGHHGPAREAADERGYPQGPVSPDEALPPGLPNRTRALLGALAVVLGLVVLALSVAVAGRPPGAWELDAVRDATGVRDVVGVPARVIMQLGTFGGVVSLAAVTLWLAAQADRQRPAPPASADPTGWRRRLAGPRLPALAVLAGGSLALVVCNRTKALVGRERPVGVRLREAQDGFGYPSSHAATAFGVALVLTFLVPARWRWLPVTLAAVVGIARLHVGVHYPLDVLGGTLIGTAVGLAVVAVANPSRRWPGARTVESTHADRG
jgi:membrane-associated phospholipid phosphatase